MAELLMKSAISKLNVQRINDGQLRRRTICTGGHVDILSGLNSASVDLNYLDPSFNSD